ncbi:hypothetical protein [Polaromonas sp.]|uniref:hypothetical protein n=1 Tax=Polaromonas sp. TaxID=1869339 RepID=UPI0025FF2479|nr:hypothetical protein [Polaromonas sp.]
MVSKYERTTDYIRDRLLPKRVARAGNVLLTMVAARALTSVPFYFTCLVKKQTDKKIDPCFTNDRQQKAAPKATFKQEGATCQRDDSD